jgi:acyl carrier protein
MPDRGFDDIEDWLTGHIAQLLDITVEDIDVREPLVSFGLSSQDMVILAGELEEWLGCQLSPTLAWEYPTIEALAKHLVETEEAEGASAEA